VKGFHHLGYVVGDLEAAAERFARAAGAGPFLMIEHVPLSEVTFDGAPAAYDHSTAFGQWGPVIVEISVVHSASPDGLGAFLGSSRPPAIGHVAWLVDDLDAESARLEAGGLPLRHTGHSGPVSAHWHDGASVLGHAVEVLRRCPEILGFYAAIGNASRNWDGSRPLRPAPPPP
jgi:catechol 2,3-dioxygenase-like lactoylglutathione lyase family enzyme